MNFRRWRKAKDGDHRPVWLWMALATILIWIFLYCASEYLIGGSPHRASADRLAAIQALADVIVIPSIVIALFQVVGDLRTALQLPKYHITIESDSRRNVLGQQAGNKLVWTDRLVLRIALHNTGRGVSPWFMVGVELPAEILRPAPGDDQLKRRYPNGYEVHRIVGGDDNWKNLPYLGGDDPTLLTFLSNSSVAAFPGWPLLLADVSVVASAVAGTYRRVPIRWRVVGERTRAVHGVCFVEVGGRRGVATDEGGR